VRDRQRQRRQEMRLLQREATWLQKALFALGKAEESREKLAEARGEEEDGTEHGYVLETEGGTLPLESVLDAIESRVKSLLELLQERRRRPLS
jgi:hypothetical protein